MRHAKESASGNRQGSLCLFFGFEGMQAIRGINFVIVDNHPEAGDS